MSNEELEALYKSNKQIKEYIDRFAKCRQIPVEVALGHIIVKNYALWVVQTTKQSTTHDSN